MLNKCYKVGTGASDYLENVTQSQNRFWDNDEIANTVVSYQMQEAAFHRCSIE